MRVSGREKKQRAWVAPAMLALCLLTACAQSPTRDVGDTTAIPPIAAVGLDLPVYAVDGLRVAQGELSWAGIRIGTRRAEVERLLQVTFPALQPNEICSSFVTTREVGSHRVTFEFADRTSNAELEQLFIALDGDLPQLEQIARLKERLPGSAYVPSRYAPDLRESDNPKPVYRVDTPRPRVVMLHHEEGLWLGDPSCYD